MLRSSWGGGGIQDHTVKGIAVISNGNKINNTHIKGFDTKRYGDSSDVLTFPVPCLGNYVRSRRAGE